MSQPGTVWWLGACIELAAGFARMRWTDQLGGTSEEEEDDGGVMGCLLDFPVCSCRSLTIDSPR